MTIVVDWDVKQQNQTIFLFLSQSILKNFLNAHLSSRAGELDFIISKSSPTSIIHMNISSSEGNNIRIYHKCESRIEKSIPVIAVWHNKAFRVTTTGDPEGRILLSYPHMNNGFFFLLTTVFIYLFILK